MHVRVVASRQCERDALHAVETLHGTRQALSEHRLATDVFRQRAADEFTDFLAELDFIGCEA